MTTGTLDIVRNQLAAKEPELRRRGVRHLAIFGSVARGENRAYSDVDLAVDLPTAHRPSRRRDRQPQAQGVEDVEDRGEFRVSLGR